MDNLHSRENKKGRTPRSGMLVVSVGQDDQESTNQIENESNYILKIRPTGSCQINGSRQAFTEGQ